MDQVVGMAGIYVTMMACSDKGSAHDLTGTREKETSCLQS